MVLDAYISVEGIPGESLDKQYNGWIEITGYSFGASQTSPVIAAAIDKRYGRKVKVLDLTFTKLADRASAALFTACCDGNLIPQVTLAVSRGTEDRFRYLEIVMDDVIVSDFIHQSDCMNDPREQVCLSFGRIRYSYTQQSLGNGGAGDIFTGGWDRIMNAVYP